MGCDGMGWERMEQVRHIVAEQLQMEIVAYFSCTHVTRLLHACTTAAYYRYLVVYTGSKKFSCTIY